MNRVFERFEEVAKISENRFSGTFFGVTMLQSALIIIGAALCQFISCCAHSGFILIQSLYCFGVSDGPYPKRDSGNRRNWHSGSLVVSCAHSSWSPDAIAMGLEIVLHGMFYVFIALMGLSALLFVPISRKSC